VEYVTSSVTKYTKPKEWFEWANAVCFVTARGKVKGSVDLEKMQIDVSTEPDKKTVLLRFEPGAIVISDPEIGKDDVKFEVCTNPNLLTSVTPEDYTAAHNAAIQALKKAALENGIEEKTAFQAKLILTGFLRELGYEATIEFADEDLNAD
jgi:hypothetical protein